MLNLAIHLLIALVAATVGYVLAGRKPPCGKNLCARAEGIRGAPKPLPMGLPDPSNPEPQIVWKVAEGQVMLEAEFAAFALMTFNHEAPCPDRHEAFRRGLIAVLHWHGLDPHDPPTGAIYDVLHRERPVVD